MLACFFDIKRIKLIAPYRDVSRWGAKGQKLKHMLFLWNRPFFINFVLPSRTWENNEELYRITGVKKGFGRVVMVAEVVFDSDSQFYQSHLGG